MPVTADKGKTDTKRKKERLAVSSRKILLIGTLCSGKTTIAEWLARDTGFPYASIDDCRVTYGDGTMDGEDRAWEKFLAVCRTPAPGILEFCGMGPRVEEVRKFLLCSSLPVLVLWLVIPLDACISRAVQRKKGIPFPYPPAPGEYGVLAIHEAVEDAWEKVWSKEIGFRSVRQEFSGNATAAEMYAVVRRICSDV